MIRLRGDSEDEKEQAKTLLAKLEELRGAKVFCLYHDQTAYDPEKAESFGWQTRLFIREALSELGHVDRLSVLLDSPGGDADEAFRLAKMFRRHTDQLEVLVVDWCKSAATLFCLAADKILIGKEGELGPLDAQLRSPKDGRQFSALQSFKSLEYLKDYAIEVLDIVSLLFQRRVGMDYIHAIRAARPIVSDIVTSLYRQVDPSELGEARRYLAVGEEYAKTLMERYAYADVPTEKINAIVRTLVWNYPSHGHAIDFREATRLGLHVERLDEASTNLCERILQTISGCIGFLVPKVHATKVGSKEIQGDGTASSPIEKEEKHEAQQTAATTGDRTV